MQVSVTEAKGKLTDLVRRAESGDEVILTRHGHAAVRLVPVATVRVLEDRKTLIDRLCASASAKATPGPCAARSQDWLYDEDGLPA
jgi:prevent-host-death family protein